MTSRALKLLIAAPFMFAVVACSQHADDQTNQPVEAPKVVEVADDGVKSPFAVFTPTNLAFFALGTSLANPLY